MKLILLATSILFAGLLNAQTLTLKCGSNSQEIKNRSITMNTTFFDGENIDIIYNDPNQSHDSVNVTFTFKPNTPKASYYVVEGIGHADFPGARHFISQMLIAPGEIFLITVRRKHKKDEVFEVKLSK